MKPKGKDEYLRKRANQTYNVIVTHHSGVLKTVTLQDLIDSPYVGKTLVSIAAQLKIGGQVQKSPHLSLKRVS